MSCILLPSFIKQPEAETLTLATMFLKFPALFFKHSVCFCATLDRVISGTSAVYMVKPCFIRCLFCLEICGGSAEASNSNKNIKSSLTTQDISTAVFLSYCFEFLRCRPCFLSSYVLSFLFIQTGFLILVWHLIQDKGVCDFCLAIISSV